jgi:ABC-type bacteriocin/lantibiotic exporter with double-glycine peptidase domain
MEKIVKLLNKQQLYIFLLIGIFVISLSFIEIIIFSFIQPIISFFSGNVGAIDNYFIKNFLKGNFFSTNILLVFFFILFILRSVIAIIISYLRQKLNSSIERNLSNKLYEKYLFKDYSFFLNSNSANFISNILIEVEKFAYQLISNITFLIVDIVLIVAISTYLLLTHFTPTIVLIVIIFSLFFNFYLFYKKKFKVIGIAKHIADAQKVSLLQKSFYSIQLIKLDHVENFFKDKFKNEVNKSSRSNFYMNFISELPRNLADLILIFVGSILLLTLYYYFNLEKNLVLAIIGLFIVAMFRILPSSNRILYAFNSVKYYYKTIDILESLTTSKEENLTYLSKNLEKIEINNSIRLENVSYAYDNLDNKRMVLSNVNLEIKKNSVIGIFGENGSGKSTILNVITGLLDPSNGYVKLDGADIKNFRESYHSIIGYVTQKTYLTDDSVVENIIFGKEEHKRDIKRFDKAIELSRLKEVIENLPQKERTLIGERGLRLSGGQQQRIGIARALYKNPQILIFDEATSALDAESESEILFSSVISQKLAKIIIIVSHNKEIFKLCDEVYFMKNGLLIKSNHEN